MTAVHRRPPDGFRYVTATAEELAARPNPHVYRVQCLDCDRRLWGSGLGIGSHRRACPGRKATR